MAGLQDDEFDSTGAGRPSTWYVRADGVTRVDYNFFATRLTLIFDPHRHELLYLDPVKRTYRVFDTGSDDAFYGSVEKVRVTPTPLASSRPTPAPKPTLSAGSEASIDGHAVRVYHSSLTDRSFSEERIEYISALPRPPVIPFPGFYQALDIIGQALGPSVSEPPDGLVLFRAVAFQQMSLAEIFKKTPDQSKRSIEILVCQRGNVRPLTNDDAALFKPPPDYREDGTHSPAPRFMFGRDPDDFVAFHECDDAVAPTPAAMRNSSGTAGQ